MNLNTIVSAQVVLIAASGAHPGPQTRITSENIHAWVPSAEAILRVSNAFRSMGFTVGECVGNSIAISGAVRLFESCFRTKLREAGGGVQFEGQGYELAANKIPSALRAQIAAVTFTPPPDFGTDTASSFRRFSMHDTHTIAVHPQPLPRAILNSTLMKEGAAPSLIAFPVPVYANASWRNHAFASTVPSPAPSPCPMMKKYAAGTPHAVSSAQAAAASRPHFIITRRRRDSSPESATPLYIQLAKAAPTLIMPVPAIILPSIATS